MSGKTPFSDLETGLSIRTKINTQFDELFDENAKSVVVAANAAAILSIPDEYKTAGKLVLQYDTQTLYQWDGNSWEYVDLKLQSTTTDYIDLVTDATVSMQEGRMSWNADDGTAEIGMPGGNVNLQIGQELMLPRRVKNDTGSDMKNGQLVYISGGDGTNAYVSLAKADAEVTSTDTIAMLTEDIDDGAKGYATVIGLVRGTALQPINTGSYTPGQVLYLSAATAGGFTGTAPTQPDHRVVIGHVFRAHASEGQILVNIRNGYEVSELHDVLIGTQAEGDYLRWNDTSKVWENKPPQFGNIDGGNYSEFETDGTLVFNGDATVYKDLIIAGANVRTGASAPTFALFKNGLYDYRFDAGASHEVHSSVELQHDYKEGSNLEFHVHWSPTTTNTGNIVWGVEYSIANMGDVFPASTNTAMTPAAAPGVVGQHTYSSITVITGTGFKIGAVINFRLYRQGTGTDTFTGNAFLHSIGVHYQCDTVGSRQYSTK